MVLPLYGFSVESEDERERDSVQECELVCLRLNADLQAVCLLWFGLDFSEGGGKGFTAQENITWPRSEENGGLL